MMTTVRSLAVVAGIAFPVGAGAEEFRVLDGEDTFLSVVNGKTLKRFGIQLAVTPEGEIEGRAFGTPVTGAWNWRDGLFCRDLFYGEQDLGPNCQLVKVNGAKIRFIADAGDGISADFRID